MIDLKLIKNNIQETYCFIADKYPRILKLFAQYLSVDIVLQLSVLKVSEQSVISIIIISLLMPTAFYALYLSIYREILVENSIRISLYKMMVSKNIFRIFIFFLVLGLGSLIFIGLIALVKKIEIPNIFLYFMSPIFILWVWAFLRFSLVMPIIAERNRLEFKNSWELMKGQVLNFVLISIIIYMPVGFMYILQVIIFGENVITLDKNTILQITSGKSFLLQYILKKTKVLASLLLPISLAVFYRQLKEKAQSHAVLENSDQIQ